MKAKLILAFLVLSLTLSLASATTYTFGSSWNNAGTAYHSSAPEEYVQGVRYTYEPTISNKISSSDSSTNDYIRLSVGPTLEKTKNYYYVYGEGKRGRVLTATKYIERESYNGGYEYVTNSANLASSFSQDYSYSTPNPTYYDAGYSYKLNPEFDYSSSSSTGSGYYPKKTSCGNYNWRF